MSDSLRDLQQRVLAFRDERDWKQFHTPKNCAANLAVEAGELLEHYRWQEIADDRQAIREEVADVLYSLLAYCDAEGIDPAAELLKKLPQNGAKYPVDKAKGSAKKYDQL